jgi:class 3 adenylate cyclase
VPDLPTGTVTFLFTDIEGSTRLIQLLRDRWPDVHADHHRLLRVAFAESGGREVDSQGDSLFYAFARARDGVAAAAAGQRALVSHAWPHGAEVRVRMGLHTGEPSAGEEGYLGLDVARAARICSAGHGGQVLLSETTKALIAADELEGIGVLSLGEHHLKDLSHPERLYQLVIAGLPTAFKPLQTLETSPANPPMELDGREEQLAAQAEKAVRYLRTSIEQRVADSLREAGVPGFGPEPDRPTPGPRKVDRGDLTGPTTGMLVVGGVFMVITAIVAVAIAYLLLG